MHADKLKTYVPAVLLTLLAFVLAYQFVDPAPPSTLTLSAGQKGGAYYAHAERYRDYLKQRGITVEVMESAGSMENIARLRAGAADIAFVQSGMVQPDQPQLKSLGSMYYEPLWVFLRDGVEVRFLSDLKGKRVAVGLKGSGTRALAMQLLKDNGIDEHAASLAALGASDAAHRLVEGTLDAVFVVSAASNKAIQALQQSDGIYLLNISRAKAYTRRMDSLSAVTLPQGAMNLARNLPEKDTQLLGRIDSALSDGFSPSLLEELDRIEAEIRKVHVPLSYAVELYDLRLHLSLIRDCALRTRNAGA